MRERQREEERKRVLLQLLKEIILKRSGVRRERDDLIAAILEDVLSSVDIVCID